MSVSFRPHKENRLFLDGISNKNSFINDILDLIRSNKIELKLVQTSSKTEVELKESKEEQKKKELELSHLESKIRYTNQRVLESGAKTRFLNMQSDFLENQGRPLSNSGKMIMAKSLKNEKINSVSCPECAQVFDYSDSRTLAQAKENLIDHYGDLHRKFFTDKELNELRQITI